jgi:hypothetical protein
MSGVHRADEGRSERLFSSPPGGDRGGLCAWPWLRCSAPSRRGVHGVSLRTPKSWWVARAGAQACRAGPARPPVTTPWTTGPTAHGDGEKPRRVQHLFITLPPRTPVPILTAVVRRWPRDATCEEAQAPLGGDAVPLAGEDHGSDDASLVGAGLVGAREGGASARHASPARVYGRLVSPRQDARGRDDGLGATRVVASGPWCHVPRRHRCRHMLSPTLGALDRYAGLCGVLGQRRE